MFRRNAAFPGRMRIALAAIVVASLAHAGPAADPVDPGVRYALSDIRRELQDLRYENATLRNQIQATSAYITRQESTGAIRLAAGEEPTLAQAATGNAFHAELPPPAVPPLLTTSGPAYPFRFTADWLYLRVSRDGLDFAGYNSDEVNTTNPQTVTLGPTELARIEPDFGSGLRLGLEYFTAGGTGLGVTWMTLSSDTRGTFVDPNGGSDGTRQHGDNNFFPDAGDGNGLARADSRYRFNMDVIDLEASRQLFPGENLTVRFSGGLRMARIQQRMSTDYYALLDNEAIHVRERVRTESYGLTAATGARWRPWHRVSFFGRLRGSLMTGFTNRNFFEVADGPTGASPPTVISVIAASSDRTIVYNVEAAAGMSLVVYESPRSRLTLDGGYELHSWMNLPDFLQFGDNNIEPRHNRQPGNIGLDGFFLRAGSEF